MTRPMPDVITDREKYERGWKGGLPETPCGAGSTIRNTHKQRQAITEWIEAYGIKSIADLGAGDLNWIRKTDLKGAEYCPYDLVPRHRDVMQYNLLTDPVPQADCLMVLWVLNHFPEAEARHALQKLYYSGARFLMMTWEPRMPKFTDLTAIESVVIRQRQDVRGNVELRLIKCSRS